ncbi:DUF4190 domain-containing protein [Frigoribacterium sp. 2-23]|uniref:DUF4190 domain-containing protein n=1 Tax=Frigoribacterium sp. 2-23 TaxID=3415006 RepID=UPI003C6FCF99
MTTPQPYSNQPAPTEKYNVLSIVAIIGGFVIPIVGIIVGFISLSQIKRTGEKGRGLALTGIIVGFAAIIIYIISIIALVAVGASDPSVYSN